MQVDARISKEWRRRMVLMGFMIYASALWFLYDGYVAWPAETARHQELLTLSEELVAAGEAADLKDPPSSAPGRVTQPSASGPKNSPSTAPAATCSANASPVASCWRAA